MRLTTAGIIFMATAWGLVTVLTVYCFSKVLWRKRKGGAER